MSYTLSVLLLIISTIAAQSDRKSSLTFVIDVTRSMKKVLSQVADSAFTLFDVVLQSNETSIENFTLITFDDPNVHFVIETRDIDEFKDALDEIELVSGDDCPEFCISGILKGIEKSLPGSTLYVFTDASASDHTLSNKVLDYAQRKEIQVIFVLTGKCKETSPIGYEVYEQIAKMTSGQVFNLLDDDVFKVFELVIESAKSRRTIAKTKTFPPGIGHKLNYTKDVEMKNTTVTIAGQGIKFNIIGPDGTIPDVEDWVMLDNVTGLKIYEKKDGLHTITVDCESDANILLSARSKIYFHHGFSTFIPSSLNDTAVKPPQVDSYLTIKIFGSFQPQNLFLIDVDENVKTNVTLDTLDDKEDLFITKKIDTPLSLFRIAVTGTHRDSNKTVTRISRMIQPNNSYIEPPAGKRPTSYIEGGLKITVEIGSPLRLKCKVNAYPEPTITWETIENRKILNSSMFLVDFPDNYISIYEVANVNKNGTYICKSKNIHGNDLQSVVVEIKPTLFLEVIKAPEDITVELNTNSDIICKVNGTPPVNITWLKNDNPILKDDHIEIAPDGSIMKILNMTQDHVGNYTCIVKNILNEKQFPFKVNISGLEAPFIEKLPSDLHLSEGSSTNLSCSVTKGKPKPKIVWYYEDTVAKTLKEITQSINKEMITLNDIKRHDPKLYVCEAQNIVSSDRKEIKIDIEWSPKIFEISNYTIVTENDDLNLLCSIKDGKPNPSIQWLYADNSSAHEIDLFNNQESLLQKNIKRNQKGIYKCVATNKIGKDTIESTVVVEYQPTIENNTEIMSYMVGDEVTLTCLANGVPKPSIIWTKDDKQLNSTDVINNEQRLIFQANLESNGLYKCEAINKLGTAIKTVKIEVEKAPTIVIDGSPKIIVEYDKPLDLKCHVSANPEPYIWWSVGTDINSKTIPGTIDTSKFPYDTINILKIDQVTSNATYWCKAENNHGLNSEQVNVETVRKSYFNVISTPKDTTIDQNSEGKLYCKVDANPPAKITWYKNTAYLTRKDGVELSADGTLTIKSMQPNQAGIYTCVARNADTHRIFNAKVTIPTFQPPEIDKKITDYYAEEGSEVSISCRLNKGYPLPKIRWLRKLKGERIFGEISSGRDMEVLKVYGGIKLDQASYMCEASNSLGSEKGFDIFAMKLHIEYSPVINSAENHYLLNVGEELNAPCLVDGNPKPTVKWFKDGISLPDIEPDKNSLRFVVNLKHRGVYTCYAENKHGTASKNVSVDVYKIRTTKRKEVDELTDVDLLCKNNGGSRKLTKTWSYKSNDPGSVPVPIQLSNKGTRRNTFIIERIRYDQAGTYICNVTNVLGETSMVVYEVDVYTPVQINKDQDITAVNGDTVLILYCNATSHPKPNIKWFKNGLNLYNTEEDTLLLQNVQASTQGEYMCEASNDKFSDNAVFRVNVQDYPLLNNPTETLEVVEGETVSVPCHLPFKKGDLLRWYKDNGKIQDGDLTIVKAKPSDAGLYTCRVSNSSISLSANTILTTVAKKISSEECLLEIDPNIEKQPLILSQQLTWPTFKYNSGSLHMPKQQSVLILCSTMLNNFNSPPYVSAYCNEDAKLAIEGDFYNYSDIRCTEEVSPQLIMTGFECHGEDTELIKVVYELRYKTIKIYEVCVSVSNMAPIIFTKHNMLLPMAVTFPQEVWLDDGILQYDYDMLYDKDRQIDSISSTLGRWFHKDDGCVFSKRQLVNALDVFPGLPQMATFLNLNVAPLWSTCSSANWDDLESRVRLLAMSTGELNVWTGVASLGDDEILYLVDDSNRAQIVPMYFWKVVQHSATHSSLAIIQINIPDISINEVTKYILCADICYNTNWMRGNQWHDVMRGYTYCCEQSDFESAFGYKTIFGFVEQEILYGP